MANSLPSNLEAVRNCLQDDASDADIAEMLTLFDFAQQYAVENELVKYHGSSNSRREQAAYTLGVCEPLRGERSSGIKNSPTKHSAIPSIQLISVDANDKLNTFFAGFFRDIISNVGNDESITTLSSMVGYDKRASREERRAAHVDSYILYVNKLTADCWYVGITTDLHHRQIEHATGKGACWATQHVVTFVDSQLDDDKKETCHFSRFLGAHTVASAERIENGATIALMRKFGWRRVRGAAFLSCDPATTRSDLKVRVDAVTFEELMKDSHLTPTASQRKLPRCNNAWCTFSEV